MSYSSSIRSESTLAGDEEVRSRKGSSSSEEWDVDGLGSFCSTTLYLSLLYIGLLLVSDRGDPESIKSTQLVKVDFAILRFGSDWVFSSFRHGSSAVLGVGYLYRRILASAWCSRVGLVDSSSMKRIFFAFRNIRPLLVVNFSLFRFRPANFALLLHLYTYGSAQLHLHIAVKNFVMEFPIIVFDLGLSTQNHSEPAATSTPQSISLSAYNVCLLAGRGASARSSKFVDWFRTVGSSNQGKFVLLTRRRWAHLNSCL